MPSKLLNFRCPPEVLEAIHQLGRDLYPADNANGCDQSKTVLEIVRAGIEALSDGSIVLPAPATVRQTPSDVKQSVSDSVLDKRITEIVASKTSAVERKTEQLQTELAELRAQLLGELAA